MLTEYEIVIADTSCFILLDKIGELGLLRSLFNQITTTPEIAGEFGKPLPPWVRFKSAKDNRLFLTLDVDRGEASAIMLALESSSALVILDDAKARKTAQKLNLTITGTLGILLKAKRNGIIDNVKPLLEKIQQTNFRFSDAIAAEILALAQESY
ncbi:DUF3368 domain-containing protein [Dyadobacter sp. MSC1_007]|jgi:predicted nucleic acid-binding protein|uniref:DUF3368 domain-containing protein n=1 Tax=Dyadobacter sp. MSC1_007 TaxID=2909264 RepID=UPI00202E045E|nr:DUF3368 domain-containing protein [Dyadobacter sp. MSC1_007]